MSNFIFCNFYIVTLQFVCAIFIPKKMLSFLLNTCNKIVTAIVFYTAGRDFINCFVFFSVRFYYVDRAYILQVYRDSLFLCYSLQISNISFFLSSQSLAGGYMW